MVVARMAQADDSCDVFPTADRIFPHELLPVQYCSCACYCNDGQRDAAMVNAMENLLTTTEIQDLLKIDRTTVYRMLKDGRLRGVKVGQQWRFSRQSVDMLLSGPPRSNLAAGAQSLPLHCVQIIQDLFADLAGVAALTAGLDGVSLTEPSGARRAAPVLQRACAEAARALGTTPQPVVCDGLWCAAAPILLDGRPHALLVAGPVERSAYAAIAPRLQRVAQSIAALGAERAAMLTRLNRIAALSTFAEDVPAALPHPKEHPL
jgi:excisionase family DNA binding protein